MKTLLIVVLSFIFIGCGNHKDSTLIPNNRIIIVGDSIAASYYLSYLVSNKFDIVTIQNAVGGYKSNQVLSEFEDRVANFNPTHVFIHVGVNDIRFGRNVDDIKSDIFMIVKKCIELNASVSIDEIGYVYGRDELVYDINDVNVFINSLISNNVNVNPYYDWTLNNEHLIPDGLHPSDEGYDDYINYIEFTNN